RTGTSASTSTRSAPRAALVWGAAVTLLALGVRLAWVVAVPTVPVSDFAMYRESANYLSEFGHLDPGFIYMPGFVVLLAWIKDAGGGLLAQKLLGVGFGVLGTGALFAIAYQLADCPWDPQRVPHPPRRARSGEALAPARDPSRW